MTDFLLRNVNFPDDPEAVAEVLSAAFGAAPPLVARGLQRTRDELHLEEK